MLDLLLEAKNKNKLCILFKGGKKNLINVLYKKEKPLMNAETD